MVPLWCLHTQRLRADYFGQEDSLLLFYKQKRQSVPLSLMEETVEKFSTTICFTITSGRDCGRDSLPQSGPPDILEESVEEIVTYKRRASYSYVLVVVSCMYYGTASR